MSEARDTANDSMLEISSRFSTAYTILYALIIFVAVHIGNIPAGQYMRQLSQDIGCGIATTEMPYTDGIGRLAPVDEILGKHAGAWVIFPTTACV